MMFKYTGTGEWLVNIPIIPGKLRLNRRGAGGLFIATLLLDASTYITL